jgi:hypothetical protein
MNNFQFLRQAGSIFLLVLTWATMISLAGPDKPDLADWENLKLVKSGSVMKVVLTDAKSYQGPYQSFTEEEILIQQENVSKHISRKEVLRISVKLPGHRGRNTLIGLAAGMAVGLGVGAVVDSKTNPAFIPYAGKVTGSILGMLGGTVIGVAVPTGGWREIYRR